jgi:capsular exopolysaccharide synthesis family protein
MVDRPQSPAAESYRQLRADLSFVAVDGSHAVFVVTSALPREGKSTLVCNLALAMAEAGVRALVIDADLRRPAIASYFGLEGAAGLTTVLSGRATFTDLVQTWGDSTLDILTAGVLPPNPSELLSARAMATLVEDVADIYDVVLIDSPPALSIADAAILGRLGDGALVVADAAQVRRPQLQQTIQSLQTAGVPVLGAVLNRVPSDKSSDVYYT